ncbi:MAG: DUF4301 family protein [Bacteroidales bacterium]|jgi:hypothetical protein|nr:DUF4301 family protein [Bacteroidales bacterium]
MLKKEDIIFLESNGIKKEKVEEQIKKLENNNNFQELSAAATVKNGIYVPEDINTYISLYDRRKDEFDIEKFVPASGAATRMFKRLISFHKEPVLKNLNDGGFYSVKTTFEEIEKFAFFGELKKLNVQISGLDDMADKILYSGLNYAHIPKGLIEFHKYPGETRTAFEEHIIEAFNLFGEQDNIKIHFTISEEFRKGFDAKLKEIEERSGKKTNICFSYQERSTDTVAVYEDGNLVREEDGRLLLRPGGHGSLLQNLNKLDSDFIFVKNIDNVIHGDYLGETIPYKKLLGGILISLIDKISEIFGILTNTPSVGDIKNAVLFLNLKFGAGFTENTTIQELINFINRPVRVCAMVKNTGEPGGGPFWVKDSSGKENLQIVEKAQIDLSDPIQKQIFNDSTHFNPVDMVCYLKNTEGQKFDLNDFVDKNSFFITEKTHSGNIIKVFEHPGLWNGSMSDWLTLFVEVPLVTFNPVKELNDLLRKEHQPK